MPEAVSADLLPLDLLSRDGQLSSQRLESTFTQASKRLVEVFLVLLLFRADFSYNLATTCTSANAQVDLLVRQQSHVAILIVVYIDLDAASQGT